MSGSPNLLGKRKVKIPKCPNPLFAKWIQEWRDDAASKKLKTSYTYNKALQALKKYPLRLESGRECRILENFGEKTCKMLDDKLAAYINEYGTAEPVAGYLNQNNNGKRPRKDDSLETVTFEHLQVPAPPCPNAADPDQFINVVRDAPARQRRNTGGPREYIPQFRSGAYAIILTLFQNKFAAHMSKKDLLQEAQPLADKSFTVPDPGSRYTAWSSVGTLIKKGLVVKESNPAKYCLTPNGQAMAVRLMEVERNGAMRPQDNDDLRFVIGDGNNPEQPDLVPPLQEPDHTPVDGISDVERGAFTSGYSYKHESSHLNTDSASCSAQVRQHAQESTSSGRSKKKYTFQSTAKMASKSTSASEVKVDAARSVSPELGHVLKPRKDSKTTKSDKPRQKVHSTLLKSVNSKKQTDDHDGDDTDILIIEEQSSSHSHVPTLSESSQSQDSVKSAPVTQVFDESKCQCILRPGTFEIILIVDNSEVFGNASDTMRQAILKELQKRNVPHSVRPLSVGDFCWVARSKGASDAELVLDYIIERKRMDDLASSIIDGRFKEQKFRLKNCGIPNAIYLVEDYGSAQHLSIGEDALLQAITNTQIVDGFSVKRTGNTKESAAYLTLMTKYIHGLYISKTLYLVDKNQKESFPKKPLGDDQAHLLSLSDLNKASVKSKTLTVREMFGKQLCQLKGMTSEKAVSVLERYPTIASLLEAYRKCITTNEKENLLTNIKFGPTHRNVGAAMSKSVFYAYNTNGADL